jgi:hypothetical protein
MAHVRVRYKSGEEDEWMLHERLDLRDLVQTITRSFVRPTGLSNFGIASESETSTADYGMAGVRWSEVVSWSVDGLVDDAALIGPWSENELGELG